MKKLKLLDGASNVYQAIGPFHAAISVHTGEMDVENPVNVLNKLLMKRKRRNDSTNKRGQQCSNSRFFRSNF